jgi:hypothetical protein
MSHENILNARVVKSSIFLAAAGKNIIIAQKADGQQWGAGRVCSMPDFQSGLYSIPGTAVRFAQCGYIE